MGDVNVKSWSSVRVSDEGGELILTAGEDLFSLVYPRYC